MPSASASVPLPLSLAERGVVGDGPAALRGAGLGLAADDARCARPTPADLRALEDFLDAHANAAKRRFEDVWGFDLDEERFARGARWVPIDDGGDARDNEAKVKKTRCASNPVPVPNADAGRQRRRDETAAHASKDDKAALHRHEPKACPSSPGSPLEVPSTPKRTSSRTATGLSPARSKRRTALSVLGVH